jgi:ABC-2 type transport system ATP-binding protein
MWQIYSFAGILDPTLGLVSYQGRLTSLIELGAGFDGELPAIDNIYLACTLMGIGKEEIRNKLDQIIDFAELKDFLDFPIKNYSSGMAARLGFACATVVDPEILLIDEVLAVGDEAFQLKCFNRINTLKQAGKSIVLVTHDMNAVERFCDRVYLLDSGTLVFEGSPMDGIERYRQALGIQ